MLNCPHWNDVGRMQSKSPNLLPSTRSSAPATRSGADVSRVRNCRGSSSGMNSLCSLQRCPYASMVGGWCGMEQNCPLVAGIVLVLFHCREDRTAVFPAANSRCLFTILISLGFRQPRAPFGQTNLTVATLRHASHSLVSIRQDFNGRVGMRLNCER